MDNIELRWKVKQSYVSDYHTSDQPSAGEHTVAGTKKEKVLQYRVKNVLPQHRHNLEGNYFFLWSEWKDVPEVME